MVTDIYFLNPTENMLCKIENYLRKSEYEEETINDSTCRFRKGEIFIDVCEGGDSVGKYITVVCSGVNNEMLRKLLCICPECGSKYVKQYIGSTYNEDGILGRWTEYYKTHHGGDVDIKEHLKKYPDAYYDFQFTILRILPKNVTDKEATGIESVYKKKLCTRNPEYGLNRN